MRRNIYAGIAILLVLLITVGLFFIRHRNEIFGQPESEVVESDTVLEQSNKQQADVSKEETPANF